MFTFASKGNIDVMGSFELFAFWKQWPSKGESKLVLLLFQ
ncbi:hypothetical protein MAR_022490, partial [Mya arenaria]